MLRVGNFTEETFWGSDRGNSVAHGFVLCGPSTNFDNPPPPKVYNLFIPDSHASRVMKTAVKVAYQCRRLTTVDLDSDSVYDTV